MPKENWKNASLWISPAVSKNNQPYRCFFAVFMSKVCVEIILGRSAMKSWPDEISMNLRPITF